MTTELKSMSRKELEKLKSDIEKALGSGPIDFRPAA